MTEPVAALADFPQRLRMASWFSFVGTPLSDAERGDIAEYADALGLGELVIEELADWRAAEDCIKQTDWDADWWNAEEERRQTLLAQAEVKVGDMALTRALTDLSEKASDIVHGAAAIAASRGGVADQGLTRSAAGAATMSAYQAAVEKAAADDVANDNHGHPFAAKFRLFEAGHWPLCVRGGTIFVF
ncbi:MAG: hypothetical protein CMM26_09110 [Rhodospirillaceae bacterium]|nr:hypothetical protein [Rhodospirillaceae bacterium]|tara:strand:- start:2294 stop:2857 length:564 start_codon:yes stop_codon:yes gene_type:complete